MNAWYVVSWDYEGLPFLFDTDAESSALRIAVSLAEWGRENVHVTAVTCEIPPEVEERVRQRVLRAIASERSVAILEAAQ